MPSCPVADEGSDPLIGDRWGVTDDEVRRAYPCDSYVKTPTLAAWRGVTVRAAVDDVWPWVTQVRLAPYSYDWIDNLGRQSPPNLTPLPASAAGQHFTRAAGIPLGLILSVEPPHQLTGRLGGVVISYVLHQPPGQTSTRLVMKLVSAIARPLADLLTVADLPMARRQLLNWKRLAEGS